jgi:hypothetical protein
MTTTTAEATKTSISKDGQTANVSIPVTFLQRSGRKQILSPQGAAPWSPAPRVDTALVKAVVRAHRWRQMLESGEYASSAELAKAEILRLAKTQPMIGSHPNQLGAAWLNLADQSQKDLELKSPQSRKRQKRRER